MPRASDRWKTSFRSLLGQFEWNVAPFGLRQGASLLLMSVINQALTAGRVGPGFSVGGHGQQRKTRGFEPARAVHMDEDEYLPVG